MVRVLGIVGISHCGSTPLGLVLNTHPDMRCVGELYHMTTLRSETISVPPTCIGCLEHKLLCDVFPPLQPFPFTDIHRYVSEKFEGRIIVDGSKLPYVFTRFEEAKSVDSFSYVIMIKRPEPQIASTLRAMRETNKHATSSDAAVIYAGYYKEVLNFMKGRRCLVLPYKEFGNNLTGVLRQIATFMSVPATFDPINYRQHRIHHVLGNSRAFESKAPLQYDDSWKSFCEEVPSAILKEATLVYEEILFKREREST